MSQPEIIETIADLRACARAWRANGETIALVPTMGALHAGHLALARLARNSARRVVVSIFVNPKQFAPNEDFARYPRTFESDRAQLAAAGVDAIYAPPASEIYPPGFVTSITLGGPAAAGLEDRFRPTHFAGVATVVAKLQIQAMPDIAIYGEKDFQQLAVIRQLTRDLDLPIEIVGGETVRESDGLALSSRNVYLDAAQRRTAPLLYATLRACAEQLRAGGEEAAILGAGRARIADAGFALDYLELRDAGTLGAPDRTAARPLRLLVAAKIGTTRLIDNIAV